MTYKGLKKRIKLGTPFKIVYQNGDILQGQIIPHKGADMCNLFLLSNSCYLDGGWPNFGLNKKQQELADKYEFSYIIKLSSFFCFWDSYMEDYIGDLTRPLEMIINTSLSLDKPSEYKVIAEDREGLDGEIDDISKVSTFSFYLYDNDEKTIESKFFKFNNVKTYGI